MNTYTLVRQEHLNHHGNLFGGQLLLWVDEFSWLTAARDFPGSQLVTRAMNEIAFRNMVACGSILRFHILPIHFGKTSIRYHIDIYADEPGAADEKEIFETEITFVNVDNKGNKCLLPKYQRPLLSEKLDCG